ncbi:peptide ABC transporter substrate-binding protein [Listeria sp. PSOL-1]|uniref:peptide ABC transporter substrate-binding protein n=1 Tax=Listeria sp. PSOL-1 TaxID=1844999 RepID=UPI0013D585D3|nr:peptide ABC transporter substrate-binding protein [Listeria sp. PSOL-1]
MKRLTKYVSFLMAIVFLFITFTACENKSNKGNGSSKEANFLETSELLTLNTTADEDFASFTAQNQVFEGLYGLNEKDEFVPAVAKAMPVISEDQKTYTIHLRSNAKWSDGSKLTAADFVYAWRRAVDPKTATGYASLFKDTVKNATEINAGKLPATQLGVKAVDEETLKIELKKPVPYFLSLLSFETFFPQKEAFLKKQGDKYGTTASHTLYNGPFIMKEWQGNTAKSWVYAKNKNYWDKDNVKIDMIHVNVSKDINAGINLFETKEADLAPLSGEYAKRYKNRTDFKTEKDSMITYLRLNQKRDGEKTPLANNALRHAINLAIDKDQLTKEILGDGSFAANGWIPKDFTQNPETGADFRKDSGSHLVYNKSKAKEYFQQAKKELNMKQISLELLGDDQEVTKTLFTYLKDKWEANLPGLTVNIKTMPAKAAMQLTLDGHYDMSLSSWLPDFKDPWTYSSLFLSDYYNNSMSYSSPKYDQLVKSTDTELATKKQERYQAFIASEKVLLDEDAAIVPLYQHQTAVLQNPKLTGVRKHSFGSPYSFKYVRLK